MGFYTTVINFLDDYPTDSQETIYNALGYGYVNLKRFVTIVIYGETCLVSGKDPLPQEFQSPFYYTAHLDNIQCIEILISVGKVKFENYFEKFCDARLLINFDIENYCHRYSLDWLNDYLYNQCLYQTIICQNARISQIPKIGRS